MQNSSQKYWEFEAVVGYRDLMFGIWILKKIGIDDSVLRVRYLEFDEDTKYELDVNTEYEGFENTEY